MRNILNSRFFGCPFQNNILQSMMLYLLAKSTVLLSTPGWTGYQGTSGNNWYVSKPLSWHGILKDIAGLLNSAIERMIRWISKTKNQCSYTFYIYRFSRPGFASGYNLLLGMIEFFGPVPKHIDEVGIFLNRHRTKIDSIL